MHNTKQLKMLAVVGFAAILLLSVHTSTVDAQRHPRHQDPTQEERDFYDTIKREFTNSSSYAMPAQGNSTDPRINVTEIMNIENSQRLIASKVCPANSAVNRVEVYASYQLVHWIPGRDLVGSFGLKSVSRSIDDDVKKIEYTFYVMFDPSVDLTDRYARWLAVTTFYHEMMHGQLTLNRIKDPNWPGWEQACRCNTPNPQFIAGVNDPEAHDHLSIEPAEDRFLETVLEVRENADVTIFNTTDIVGEKDGDGNRPFRKIIPLPDGILEKGGMTWMIYRNNDTLEVDAELDRNNGTLVVSGTIYDDRTGKIKVIVDPPEFVMVVSLQLLSPNPVTIPNEPVITNIPNEEDMLWWMWLIAIPIIVGAIVYWRMRK